MRRSGAEGRGSDPARALIVERHAAEWFAEAAVVPGAEVHVDPDVTWIVTPGRVWGNAGVMVRFSEESAPGRLDTLLARYRAHGRGMGLWVSPAATPEDLPALLRGRRLHCRKHFPAMVKHLVAGADVPSRGSGVTCRTIEDPDEFLATPHPSIGPITTPLRRQALASLRAHVLARPQRTLAFVAELDGAPVGASLLFLGSECSGLHDLTVVERFRGRGIGRALLDHTCLEARRRGATTMALLATSDGQRVYDRAGFEEVARFGYWYRSFQNGASR